jgi:hypothetical protein
MTGRSKPGRGAKKKAIGTGRVTESPRKRILQEIKRHESMGSEWLWAILYAHLKRGTHLDNARDRDDRGRNHNAQKTHCIRNHALTPDNVRIDSRGWRVCRTCRPHNR